MVQFRLIITSIIEMAIKAITRSRIYSACSVQITSVLTRVRINSLNLYAIIASDDFAACIGGLGSVLIPANRRIGAPLVSITFRRSASVGRYFPQTDTIALRHVHYDVLELENIYGKRYLSDVEDATQYSLLMTNELVGVQNPVESVAHDQPRDDGIT